MIDKEYLICHREKRKELQDELNRFELEHGYRYYGKSPSDIDGMPHGSGGGKNGVYDQVVKNCDEMTHIDKLKNIIKEEEREIERVLALLNKAEQKSVIRYKYYSCIEWGDIAFYLYGDRRDYIDKTEYYKSKAQKVHGTALANILKYQRKKQTATE